jgi:hypothetical protein
MVLLLRALLGGLVRRSCVVIRRWFMLGRHVQKWDWQGTGTGAASRLSWLPGQKLPQSCLKSAKFGGAVAGEIVSVLVCLMAYLTQQYRCRGELDTSAVPDLIRWMVNSEGVNLLG